MEPSAEATAAGPAEGDLISRSEAERVAVQAAYEHRSKMCVHAKPCELFVGDAIRALPAVRPAPDLEAAARRAAHRAQRYYDPWRIDMDKVESEVAAMILEELRGAQ